MTIQVSGLGRLRMAVEPTFNTSLTASVGNYIDLPALEGTVQFTALQEHLEPGIQQSFVHSFTNSNLALGKKSSTLNFSTHLAGTGAPVTGLNTSLFPNENTWASKKLLKTLMGGAVSGTLGAGSVLALVGSTATSITVTSAYGTTMGIPGGAMAVYINGKYEAREILSSTATTIVPKVAFSADPAANAPMLFATTFHLIEGTTSNLDSLQFLVEGVQASDEWAGLGMQGTFGIDVTPGQLAKLTVQLQGASYIQCDSTTALSAVSASVGYYPLVNMDSELILGGGSLTACQSRTLIQHAASTWQPGFAVVPITSPDGINSSNIVGFKRARGRAVTGNFVAYEDGALGYTWAQLDNLGSNAKFSLAQQIGSTSKGMVLITAPTCQIQVLPTRTDSNGLQSYTVTWVGENDLAINGATDALRSAMRIHLF